jgi:hypothetical protein
MFLETTKESEVTILMLLPKLGVSGKCKLDFQVLST